MNRFTHFAPLAAALALALTPLHLRAQPLASPSEMYAPVADVQSDDANPQVAELQKVSDMWDEAVHQRDSYGLDLVLSPQLVDVSSSGQVSSRDALVARVTQKNSPVVSLDQTVASVRVIANIAIVNGTYALKFHNDQEGRKLKDETGVYSQVFERLQNTWVCINSQRTALTAENAAPANKKNKSQAKSEMGREARPNSFNPFDSVNLPAHQP